MPQYGLVRQKEDSRDFRLPRMDLQPLPRFISIRASCPPVFDQGALGSCTANAGAAARMMLAGTSTVLSRLFLYYKERALHGDEDTDSGAQMRDICRVLRADGICEESYDPYDVGRFTDAPPAEAVRNALQYKITSYATFDGDAKDDLQQIRLYLATKKLPVLIGMDVYESFESPGVANTGWMPMPDTGKEKIVGSHAVLIVGYNDMREVLIVRNSWGDSWGDGGYFYMPYNYVKTRLAYDSWTIAA